MSFRYQFSVPVEAMFLQWRVEVISIFYPALCIAVQSDPMLIFLSGNRSQSGLQERFDLSFMQWAEHFCSFIFLSTVYETVRSVYCYLLILKRILHLRKTCRFQYQRWLDNRAPTLHKPMRNKVKTHADRFKKKYPLIISPCDECRAAFRLDYIYCRHTKSKVKRVIR